MIILRHVESQELSDRESILKYIKKTRIGEKYGC